MNDQLSSFFLAQSEPNKSCFLALRDVILILELEETIKYGMPSYTFQNRPLCYLWKDKKTGTPYILFVDGQSLQHPALRQDHRAKMKVLPVDPSTDLDVATIRWLVEEAIKLRR